MTERPQPPAVTMAKRLMCALLGAMIAAGPPGSATGSEYRAPDGRVLERDFQMPAMPPLKIVVCSDRPDVYIPKLRKFIAYVLSDFPYSVSDGREVPEQSALAGIYLAYVGHPPAETRSDACLQQFPQLRQFVEDRRDSVPRTRPAREVSPAAREGDVARAFVHGSYAPNEIGEGSSMTAFFCYPEDVLCEVEIFTGLFGIGPEMCWRDGCGFLDRMFE